MRGVLVGAVFLNPVLRFVAAGEYFFCYVFEKRVGDSLYLIHCDVFFKHGAGFVAEQGHIIEPVAVGFVKLNFSNRYPVLVARQYLEEYYPWFGNRLIEGYGFGISGAFAEIVLPGELKAAVACGCVPNLNLSPCAPPVAGVLPGVIDEACQIAGLIESEFYLVGKICFT